MVSPLLGSLAATIGSAMSSLFLDAMLTRDVPNPGSDPAEPLPPSQVQYSCKAIEQNYGAGLLAQGLVNATDVKLLILASTIAVDPLPGDRVTIRGVTYAIVPQGTGGLAGVTSDPARATWECRATK